MAQAHELGRLLNQKGISLVFGGGNHGLMGAVCDGILEGDAPGGVVAVIPKFMIEQVHVKVGKVDVVQTMHERKAMMAKEGDGFVALPGTGFPPPIQLDELHSPIIQILGFPFRWHWNPGGDHRDDHLVCLGTP